MSVYGSLNSLLSNVWELFGYFSGGEKRRPEMRPRSHTRGGLSIDILTISVTRLGCIVHKKNQRVVMQGVIWMIAYIRSWPYRGSDVPFIFIGGGRRGLRGLQPPHYFFVGWGAQPPLL